MIDRIDVLERLSRPEYTGDNRCLPCTVVNVALAAAIASVLSLAVTPVVGVAALGVFLAAIWLRGYLIPGTPPLTRRYFPEWLLAAFGKAVDRPTVEIESADLEAALESLAAGGVVTERDEGGVRPTADFRDRWDDRLEAFRAETPAADSATDETAAETSTDPDWHPPDADDVAAMYDAEVERRGAAFELEGSKRLRWESDAALAADVAADRELRTRLEGWAALDPDDRGDVLVGLRLLRERCPTPGCEGRLSRDVERLEHCCRRPAVGLESACETCGRSIASLAVSPENPLLEWLPARETRRAVDADA